MVSTELIWSDEDCEIHNIVVGPLYNNVYFLRCIHTGEALMIDAANEHNQLLELCRRFGVRTIVETHGHFDHIGAVADMREAGYEIGVAVQDATMLPSYDYTIDDDVVIEVGDLRVKTALTPGHTPGSMCFSVQTKPLLFTGDTLFPGGPGRTDLPGGDFDEIEKSLKERVFTYGDSTLILPGHGRTSTIGTERPSLDQWLDRRW